MAPCRVYVAIVFKGRRHQLAYDHVTHIYITQTYDEPKKEALTKEGGADGGRYNLLITVCLYEEREALGIGRRRTNTFLRHFTED